jgi:Zn-dependent protease
MPMSLNNLELLDIIARLLVLVLAMPVHEYSHAAMAVRLGDDTPIRQGRLTLNPVAHLSLIGSIALMFMGFGWAKPVMVDMRNLKSPKRDMALISIMGPLANILAALAVLVFYRILLGVFGSPQTDAANSFFLILIYMILINLTLAVFNLMPIPPLDGSKVLGAFLPDRYYRVLIRREGIIIVAVLVLLYTGMLTGPIGFLRDLLLRFLLWITMPIELLFR